MYRMSLDKEGGVGRRQFNQHRPGNGSPPTPPPYSPPIVYDGRTTDVSQQFSASHGAARESVKKSSDRADLTGKKQTTRAKYSESGRIDQDDLRRLHDSVLYQIKHGLTAPLKSAADRAHNQNKAKGNHNFNHPNQPEDGNKNKKELPNATVISCTLSNNTQSYKLIQENYDDKNLPSYANCSINSTSIPIRRRTSFSHSVVIPQPQSLASSPSPPLPSPPDLNNSNLITNVNQSAFSNHRTHMSSIDSISKPRGFYDPQSMRNCASYAENKHNPQAKKYYDNSQKESKIKLNGGWKNDNTSAAKQRPLTIEQTKNVGSIKSNLTNYTDLKNAYIPTNSQHQQLRYDIRETKDHEIQRLSPPENHCKYDGKNGHSSKGSKIGNSNIYRSKVNPIPSSYIPGKSTLWKKQERVLQNSCHCNELRYGAKDIEPRDRDVVSSFERCAQFSKQEPLESAELNYKTPEYYTLNHAEPPCHEGSCPMSQSEHSQKKVILQYAQTNGHSSEKDLEKYNNKEYGNPCRQELIAKTSDKLDPEKLNGKASAVCVPEVSNYQSESGASYISQNENAYKQNSILRPPHNYFGQNMYLGVRASIPTNASKQQDNAQINRSFSLSKSWRRKKVCEKFDSTGEHRNSQYSVSSSDYPQDNQNLGFSASNRTVSNNKAKAQNIGINTSFIIQAPKRDQSVEVDFTEPRDKSEPRLVSGKELNTSNNLQRIHLYGSALEESQIRSTSEGRISDSTLPTRIRERPIVGMTSGKLTCRYSNSKPSNLIRPPTASNYRPYQKCRENKVKDYPFNEENKCVEDIDDDQKWGYKTLPANFTKTYRQSLRSLDMPEIIRNLPEDYREIPGFAPIEEELPEWKKQLLERKNAEAIERYLDLISAQRSDKLKYQGLPDWKVNILRRREDQIKQNSSLIPIATAESPIVLSSPIVKSCLSPEEDYSHPLRDFGSFCPNKSCNVHHPRFPAHFETRPFPQATVTCKHEFTNPFGFR